MRENAWGRGAERRRVGDDDWEGSFYSDLKGLEVLVLPLTNFVNMLNATESVAL